MRPENQSLDLPEAINREAFARVTWGEDREQVELFLAEKGVPGENRREFLDILFKSRVRMIKSLGATQMGWGITLIVGSTLGGLFIVYGLDFPHGEMWGRDVWYAYGRRRSNPLWVIPLTLLGAGVFGIFKLYVGWLNRIFPQWNHRDLSKVNPYW